MSCSVRDVESGGQVNYPPCWRTASSCMHYVQTNQGRRSWRRIWAEPAICCETQQTGGWMTYVTQACCQTGCEAHQAPDAVMHLLSCKCVVRSCATPSALASAMA
ncbi:hypothetical protein GWK47_003551 [Chionoecetes opilio]|uniref:Uncharacterized protein n=1 Tax=Chionoecetes opilio TaxID=41210 RepID=A0A8J5D525_CHIOP|nr:hypothetical protein GWK47_003551 [Chionoecetes opilio]